MAHIVHLVRRFLGSLWPGGPTAGDDAWATAQLLRGDPEAFASGNVNRLKAGAVLDIPTIEGAGLVPTDEARRSIVVQSRDFNDFRRRLAEGLPATRIDGSERSS